jgi:hypothetical protein
LETTTEAEMYARVARWEGADPKSLEESAADIRTRAESEGGPPPGVPAKEFLLLHDTAAGKALAITLFESEEDYREGDATLNSMSPPGGGMGERISVEKFELAVRVEA